MVRITASQLRESGSLVAEAAFPEHIGKALRQDLGASRRATKTVMRWTEVSDTTARSWISGRSAPSGWHLLTLAANSDRVMTMILQMTGHDDLEVGLELERIKEGLDQALSHVCAMLER